MIGLPIVPVAAANLPNGAVLTWSAYSSDNFDATGANPSTQVAFFDPVSQTSSQRTVNETNHDMFCPGTSLLADGRLLINGGSNNSKTTIYDPANDSWTSSNDMNIRRGYPGNATLADGSVLTLGGSWNEFNTAKNGEVWSPNGTWRTLSGVPIGPFIGPDPAGTYRGDNHAWLFTYTNGRVFHAGPSAAMHWITTAGNGTVSNAGNRADDVYSMNGNAVMYDIGKILKTGGAPAYENVDASAASYVIDLNSVTTRKLAPMNFARAMHNSVVLPNGQVVISGGQTYVKLFSDDRSVLMTEIWDPKTEAFTKLSAMSVPRNYHSFSLLLHDGRVLIGGGGLCGSCTVNHKNVQILTPPYLLNADGSAAARPAISQAPAVGAYGSTQTVAASGNATSFALVRFGAVTHSLNNDQRRVPLQASTTDGVNFNVQMPANSGIAPPGYYMLFAMNANGTPSVARTIRIQ